MKLKYADFIDKFENCIAADCYPRNREAFRWTFQEISDERNFVPRYLIPSYPDPKKVDCTGYALSMFDNEEQATEKLKMLNKKRGKSFKKLGTHLAKGKLSINDGLSSASSAEKRNYGHFSFFESESADLAKKFRITKQVII